MNIIFISPHFPLHFFNFCDRLKHLGANVLGIGDAPYDSLLNAVNRKQESLGHRLLPSERFPLMEQLITSLSVGNKLNLLVWDGTFLYVHSNYAHTLHYCRLASGGLLFSTHPLRCLPAEDWQPLPFLRLMVYQGGETVYTGAPLSQEYFDSEENYEYKELDYANL